MEQKAKVRCTKIEHPNLQPGWGCCVCRHYNGNQRQECKACNHKRCDSKNENQPS
jgi:hypothetical protein